MTKLYPYQKKIYSELNDALQKHPIVCIAATTGFGKTEVIAKFIEDNPGKSFLILTHGQMILRRNFYERLVSKKSLKDQVFEVTDTRQIKKSKGFRIVIALPHSIHRHLDKLQAFDYLIVDEAHEYYAERENARHETVMYKTILGWHKGKEILLTASHYVLKGVPKVFFSREEALSLGHIADVRLRVDESEFRLKSLKSYNENGDLKSSIDVKSSIGNILPYLKPENYPIIIARHSQKAADQLGAFLSKDKNYKGLFTVSHGDNDTDSENIDAFKRGEYKICIVVQRAALGFDYPDLRTYVDATFTRSLIRVEQMIGRVARKNGSNCDKKFIKLSAKGIETQTNLLIVAALALGEKNLYKKWNEFENDIPIRREAITKGGILPASLLDDPYGDDEDMDRKDAPIAQYLMSFQEYYKLSEKGSITFSEAMDIIKSINSRSYNRQKEIMAWARSGRPKPAKNDPQYSMFHCYLSPSQNGYDPFFVKELMKERPDWFEAKTNVEGNKKTLLKMANEDAPRPSWNDKIGVRFFEYINPKYSSYDKDFEKKIRKIRPDWFISKYDEAAMIKEMFIEKARKGEDMPRMKDQYYGRYKDYMASSSSAYDPGFYNKIKKIAPDWLRYKRK